MTLEEILGSNNSNITIKNAKPKVNVGAVMSQYNTYQADAINSPYNKEWKGFIAMRMVSRAVLKALLMLSAWAVTFTFSLHWSVTLITR